MACSASSMPSSKRSALFSSLCKPRSSSSAISASVSGEHTAASSAAAAAGARGRFTASSDNRGRTVSSTRGSRRVMLASVVAAAFGHVSRALTSAPTHLASVSAVEAATLPLSTREARKSAAASDSSAASSFAASDAITPWNTSASFCSSPSPRDGRSPPDSRYTRSARSNALRSSDEAASPCASANAWVSAIPVSMVAISSTSVPSPPIMSIVVYTETGIKTSSVRSASTAPTSLAFSTTAASNDCSVLKAASRPRALPPPNAIAARAS
mmetsp:Transcript_16405/g.53581  ORF Transcript_16405/g.53581 Transcript_16405/m.53581 type:complete len:270 (+) Transcript_16405:325-1134(+)